MVSVVVGIGPGDIQDLELGLRGTGTTIVVIPVILPA
jgi:hypothetical protein